MSIAKKYNQTGWHRGLSGKQTLTLLQRAFESMGGGPSPSSVKITTRKRCEPPAPTVTSVTVGKAVEKYIREIGRYMTSIEQQVLILRMIDQKSLQVIADDLARNSKNRKRYTKEGVRKIVLRLGRKFPDLAPLLKAPSKRRVYQMEEERKSKQIVDDFYDKVDE